jgi:hypothetical protein
VLGFCNARLGTEESNKAELPLDKDCLTLEIEDLHLIDFRNEGCQTLEASKSLIGTVRAWLW